LISERLGGVIFAGANRLFRQPEVEQLNSLLGDEYIGGLQITMRDALLMGRIERV
jgi:hypothetical protein